MSGMEENAMSDELQVRIAQSLQQVPHTKPSSPPGQETHKKQPNNGKQKEPNER